MSATVSRRIDPSEIPGEELKALYKVVEGHATAMLIGAEGERIVLPKALNDLLLSVVHAMERREAVFLMNENEAFTTQAAASFLGMSRQYLVRLLDEGAIPCHRVGTHRRVYFKDLILYQRRRSIARKAALDKMTEDAVKAGVYDRYLPPDEGGSEG